MNEPGQCSRCGACSDEEAQKVCSPGEDDCPMCFQDEWPTAQQLKDRYSWEPPSEEPKP